MSRAEPTVDGSDDRLLDEALTLWCGAHMKIIRIYATRYTCTVKTALHPNNSPHPINATTEQYNAMRASLARENEAEDNWGQEVHILHVNV